MAAQDIHEKWHISVTGRARDRTVVGIEQVQTILKRLWCEEKHSSKENMILFQAWLWKKTAAVHT